MIIITSRHVVLFAIHNKLSFFHSNNHDFFQVGSASGAVCKRIKKWTTKFTKDELEFFALFYPAEPWKRLADIVHFNPEKVIHKMSSRKVTFQ